MPKSLSNKGLSRIIRRPGRNYESFPLRIHQITANPGVDVTEEEPLKPAIEDSLHEI